MHQLFLFYSEAETGFHSRERAALIWVWCLYTLPQTHPLSPSLSLSLRIPRIPLRLWHLPHTTWFDEGNSLEHAFRERENGLKKSEGERKRNKELCCFCQQLAAEDRPPKRTPTPATNHPCRRHRITQTPCVPYSALQALIPSSGFLSTFALWVCL